MAVRPGHLVDAIDSGVVRWRRCVRSPPKFDSMMGKLVVTADVGVLPQ